MQTITTAVFRRAGRLQFGLRGLFLATTIFGVWLGMYLHRARQQQAAVRAILSRGGKVYYDVQKYGDVNARPRWPTWLAGLLGGDENFFREVVQIELDRNTDDSLFTHVAKLTSLENLNMQFGAPRITDGGVTQLGGLTNLRGISLTDSQVTDESLRILGQLPRIEGLILLGARVSDAGLAYLKHCSELRSLFLEGEAMAVTDDGMRSIGGLLKLEGLALNCAKISFIGVEHLEPLANLRTLRLSNKSAVGDEGLRRIAHLSALEELVLPSANLTSSGLKHLERLKNLRILDLSHNRGITDEGLSCLSRLVNLEVLKLGNTAISSNGIRHLAPLVKIQRLDLSENAAITEDVATHLAKLPAVTMLDLHNTCAAGRSGTSVKLRCLRKLTSLSLLDLSGTGAKTRSLDVAPTGCYLVASHSSRLDGDGGLGYLDVHREVVGIAYDGPPDDKEYKNPVARLLREQADQSTMRLKYANYQGRSVREKALESTLGRMLTVGDAAGADPAFARQRPLVEEFARRLRGLRSDDARGVGKTFSKFLAASESNLWLRRLYAAASDLHFADALRAHIQYLDGVKQNWALTDVELHEYKDATASVRDCLRDASAQLGLRIEPSSEQPLNRIIAIWEHTRPPPKPKSYADYWSD